MEPSGRALAEAPPFVYSVYKEEGALALHKENRFWLVSK